MGKVIFRTMTGFAEKTPPPYAAPMTKAEFYGWAARTEGRFELKNGRVLMQAGGTKRHNQISKNFVSAVDQRLDTNLWASWMVDIAVEIGEDIRYPDVMVEKRQPDDASLRVDQPVVLIEVLSPSSVGTDLTDKLAEYTSIASLECYIVASQDEAICWVWQRTGGDRVFPSAPAEIKGREQSIDITAVSISLPLAEIYRGIGAV